MTKSRFRDYGAWFSVAIFAFIQLTSVLIKNLYQSNTFMVVFTLIMIILLIWIVNKGYQVLKKEIKNGNKFNDHQ